MTKDKNKMENDINAKLQHRGWFGGSVRRKGHLTLDTGIHFTE